MTKDTLKAGATYFGIVFGAGFVFGTIRQLWAVPRLGEMTAELIEMPFMLVVIVLAAGWTVSRFRIEPLFRPRLVVGLIALGLLLFAELTLVLGLRQLTLPEYIETRDPVSGTVYLVMLGVYALMPSLVDRRADE